MSRSKYVWRNGEWLEVDLNAPRPKPRAPMIHVYESFQSPIDDSVLRGPRDVANHEREHGVIQVGTEKTPPRDTKPKNVKRDVAQAMKKLDDGSKPVVKMTQEDLTRG